MTPGSTTPLTPVAPPPVPARAGVQDPLTLAAGTRLDEFEIVRLLGVGGFGIVYLALDHSLLRYVALKEFMPNGLAGRAAAGLVRPRSGPQAEQFERGLESFLNEARLLARFSHPALVRVYRFWKANGTAYMAMQYYPGRTLKEARSEMRSPPDEAWLSAFIDPLLGALERLHDEGVFHRDISPDNILLLPNGRPVLLDFGSARRVIGSDTRSLTAIVKPNFAPVEQYGDETGMPQGPWTDLYALGATVHFMLTGQAPTPAVLRAVQDVRVPLVATGAAQFQGVQRRFLAAIDWTLAVAPNDRPQSVAALRQALRGRSAEMSAPAARATSPGATPSSAKARRRLATPVASALVGIGLLGFAAWTWAPSRTTSAAALAPAAAVTSAAAATLAAAVAPAAAVTSAASIAASAPIATPPPQPASAAVLPLAERATLVATPTATPRSQPRAAPKPESDDAGVPADRPHAPAPRPVSVTARQPPASPQQAIAARSDVAPQSPAEVCSGRNFLTRAICMSRQCKAPGSRLHPECAEVQRTEEQRQQRVDR